MTEEITLRGLLKSEHVDFSIPKNYNPPKKRKQPKKQRQTILNHKFKHGHGHHCPTF